MHIIKIASININGIRSPTRVRMLMDFLRKHDLDIVLIQEIVDPESVCIIGYLAHTNIGPDMRGNAIIARKYLHITQIDRIPSGRAIAAEFHGTRLINVYAPSGTSKRTQRECFFLTELPALLSADSQSILLGGDLNCTLHPADSTGSPVPSRALEETIHGLALTDTWEQDPQRPVYTHYAPTGATRIDRVYLSKADINRKTGIEIIPTAFTDHHAVVLRLTIPVHVVWRARGRWIMDPPRRTRHRHPKQDKPRMGTMAQIQTILSGYGGVVRAPRKYTPQAPYTTRRNRAEQEPQHHGKPFIRMSL
jgi:exonuclease III